MTQLFFVPEKWQRLEKTDAPTKYISNCIKRKSTTNISVKTGLLHDPQEFLLIHFPISISICFINHFLYDVKDSETKLDGSIKVYQGREGNGMERTQDFITAHFTSNLFKSSCYAAIHTVWYRNYPGRKQQILLYCIFVTPEYCNFTEVIGVTRDVQKDNDRGRDSTWKGLWFKMLKDSTTFT